MKKAITMSDMFLMCMCSMCMMSDARFSETLPKECAFAVRTDKENELKE